MPIIYLSPSTQEGNAYVSGGSEEYYMNLLADKMEPYLQATGIDYVRNTPDMTAATSIAASNAGDYDLHLALHSNAAPDGRYGTIRGIIVFYCPGSREGQRAATILSNDLKAIYPLPYLVRAQGTTSIGEVRRVRAPSAFLELGYHDNREDAAWVTENLELIAQNLVMSLADYFDLTFRAPGESQIPGEGQTGRVDVDWGVLNLRARPDLSAPILIQAPDGASLQILGKSSGWYQVEYAGVTGYAKDDFVRLA